MLHTSYLDGTHEVFLSSLLSLFLFLSTTLSFLISFFYFIRNSFLPFLLLIVLYLLSFQLLSNLYRLKILQAAYVLLLLWKVAGWWIPCLHNDDTISEVTYGEMLEKCDKNGDKELIWQDTVVTFTSHSASLERLKKSTESMRQRQLVTQQTAQLRTPKLRSRALLQQPSRLTQRWRMPFIKLTRHKGKNYV
jgi:hypothetical protein